MGWRSLAAATSTTTTTTGSQIAPIENMNAVPPGAAFMCPGLPAHQPRGVLTMFFFSNRLGCGGSILLSLTVTGALLLLLAR